MPSTTVTRGNVLNTVVLSANITPAAVATVTSAEQTFPVVGLQANDQVSAFEYQGAWTVLVDIVNLRVVSAGTLGVSFQNGTGGSVTPPAGVYLLEINRPEYYPLPTNAT